MGGAQALERFPPDVSLKELAMSGAGHVRTLRRLIFPCYSGFLLTASEYRAETPL
jgi:hypothetical protein